MALTFDGVTLDLGRRRVLDRVSVGIAAGRVTAILGPNGAGKTSLLRVAAGLVQATSGSVAIDGTEVAAMPRDKRAQTIGYLPQQGDVAWNMVARDVTALGRLPHRAGAAANATAMAAALAATDTAALADRRIGELSGGERARVWLARVLAGEPNWLLADEPLANLDPAHQIDMLGRLRDVALKGAGVVIVLHDLAHAARIADDVLLLKAGRVAAFGAAADVLAPDAVAEVFEIAVRWVEVDGRRVLVPLGRI